MNKRIKQLAEEANIEFTYDPTETPVRAFVECWEDDLEKFADMIVQECVRKVRNRGGMCGALASNWIEEHFYGVEE